MTDYLKLKVCVDCAAVIANADWESALEGYTGDEKLQRASAIESGITLNRPGYWVLTCCGDDENDCTYFSSWPCDCCNSRLGGARHSAGVLECAY
jgi:hypothetical protein